MGIRWITLLFIWAASGAAHAKFKLLVDDREQLLGYPYPLIEQNDHINPNEHFPQDAKSAYQRAAPGVYLSVGTERSFIGAANGGRITHLLLADYDERIVAYNIVNVYLLHLSSSRENYLELRQGDLKFWKEAAAKSDLSSAQIEFLMREHAGWSSVSHLNQQPWSKNTKRYAGFEVPPKKGEPFYGVSYLYDDSLYAHLKLMADQGKIGVIKANLGDETDVRRIADILDRHQLKLGAFDVSNAWWSSYIPYENFAKTLEILDRFAAARTLLITTAPFAFTAHFLGDKWTWVYSAFTFARIRMAISRLHFVKSLWTGSQLRSLWNLQMYGWTHSRKPCTFVMDTPPRR